MKTYKEFMAEKSGRYVFRAKGDGTFRGQGDGSKSINDSNLALRYAILFLGLNKGDTVELGELQRGTNQGTKNVFTAVVNDDLINDANNDAKLVKKVAKDKK